MQKDPLLVSAKADAVKARVKAPERPGQVAKMNLFAPFCYNGHTRDE